MSREHPTDILCAIFLNYSEDNFIHELSRIDWVDIISPNETNIDKAFSCFYNKLNKMINKHAPLKPISWRKIKSFTKLWITKGIRKSIKMKNKLLDGGNIKLFNNYSSSLALFYTLIFLAFLTLLVFCLSVLCVSVTSDPNHYFR